MDLEKLLRRVKAVDLERNATLDTLRKLCMSFMANIPFENTDMHGGKTKLWDLEIIYENIVVKNLGGFCFDLNGLLQWVLKQFGFKVDMLKAYYVKPDGKLCETSDHMTLMVGAITMLFAQNIPGLRRCIFIREAQWHASYCGRIHSECKSFFVLSTPVD